MNGKTVEQTFSRRTNLHTIKKRPRQAGPFSLARICFGVDRQLIWQIEHAMASDRTPCVGLTLPLTLLGRADEVIDMPPARNGGFGSNSVPLATGWRDRSTSDLPAGRVASKSGKLGRQASRPTWKNLLQYRTPAATKPDCVSENPRFDQHGLALA